MVLYDIRIESVKIQGWEDTFKIYLKYRYKYKRGCKVYKTPHVSESCIHFKSIFTNIEFRLK